MITTEQTVRFPITSARGNAYIMVLYYYDSNVINTTAIKSRKKEYSIEGYNRLHKDLQKAEIQPLLYKLDNERLRDLISSIEEKELDYQLAPPYDHRQKPAEQVI